MTIWESGRESDLLDEIIARRKTIEGRLNRDKFAQYKPGDVVKLRRDYRDANGVLQDGEPDQVRVEVIAVRHYKTSLEMMQAEGYERVNPVAKNVEESARIYDKYYSKSDQQKYGLLAIEFKLIS